MIKSIAATALIFAFVVWWVSAQWVECRDAGFSVLYCLQHIS